VSAFLTNLVLFFAAVLIVASAIIDLGLARRPGRFLVVLGLVVAFGLVLHWAIGFPEPNYSFGPRSELFVVAVILFFVLLGMAAHYVFYQDGPFVVREFLKPMLISPIVLLPLLGIVQGREAGVMEYVCFGILGFQNGFFWQKVLEGATPKT
jgi:hypothetical protein